MELEIKVMWCKGLTAFNFFQKLTVYATVSLITDDQKLKLTQNQKQEQKTPVDLDGDGDPEWNFLMKFDLNLLPNNSNFHDFSLLFELRHRGQLFGDKIIGEVRVPLKDLIDSVGFGFVRFVSYEVRNLEGKHNGILDFSYKVIGNVENRSEIQITGYDHLNHHLHHNHNQNQSSNPEKIEYPKIDLGDLSTDENEQVQYYPPPPYFPPPSYPPPGPPPLWGSPPPHLTPPPPPPPFLYPRPPYGNPHWPPNYQQSTGWYDYSR